MERRAGYGFAKVTATDERSDIRTVTTYGDQSFPYAGLTTRTDLLYVGGASDVLLERNDFTLDSTSSGGVYFPFVASRTARRYELDGTLVSKTVTTHSFDSYGNPDSIAMDLFETEAQSTPVYTSDTTSVFRNDTSNWLIGQLICQTTDASAGATSETRTVGFEYGSTGLITKEVIEPTASSLTEPSGFAECETLYDQETLYDVESITLIRTYGHDAFGNRTSITADDLDSGIPSRATTVAYGELDGGTTITETNGRFPVKITNAKGHIEYRQFDPRFGAAIRVRDPNGIETEWALDSYGRVTTEYRDDSTQSDFYLAWCTSQTCPDGGAVKTLTVSDGAPSSATIVDFLGREVTSGQQGFDGTAVVTSVECDDEGQVSRRSLPYYDGDCGTSTDCWYEYVYDALARVTEVTAPGSIVTTTEYHPLEIRTTNESNQETREYFNARGELIEVIDGYGNTTPDISRTQYAYDVFGNLTDVEVDQNSATHIDNTFDIRGRKIGTSDPDMGDWTYEYNAFGELVAQTDAKSQTATFDYDVLGRMVERIESEGTTTFTFDTATNGKGRLAYSSAAEGEAKTLTYDSLGRVDTVTTTIDSTDYVVGYGYDTFGRMDKVTYPASTEYPTGLRVRYDFNAIGYVDEVRNDDTSNALFWRLDDRTAEGQWTATTFGNGVTTNYTYVAETRLVDTIKTSSASGTNDIQNLNYTFDPLGNLDTLEDARQNISEEFGYDPLNRLTSVERFSGTTSQGTKSTTYDALGNLKTKTGVSGTYTYGNPGTGCYGGPHALTSAGGQSLCYDANGNLTGSYNFVQGRTRSVTWTSYNKPATVTEASQTLTFSYGAGRARFKQVNAFTGQTTIYVDGIYEKETIGAADTHVHHIFAYGEAVAIYKSRSDSTEETFYLHRDHLGNVTEVSDDSGSVANVERLAYDAWGQRRNPDWTDATGQLYPNETPRGYTGHEHLDDVSLVHMNGRVYDPALGRMLSPDPIVQLGGYSQSYNRYSYVLNNPLAFTDPSGYCIASGPSCPVSGLAGGLMGSLTQTASTSTSVNTQITTTTQVQYRPQVQYHVFVFYSSGSWIGVPRTPPRGGCTFGSGSCGTTGISFDDIVSEETVTIDEYGVQMSVTTIVVAERTTTTSYSYTEEYSTTSPYPNQSQGSTTAFKIGVYFEKPAGVPDGTFTIGSFQVSWNYRDNFFGRMLESGDAVSIGVGLSPAGVFSDIYTAGTGEDYFTGEEVPGWMRAAVLVPGVSELRKTGRVADAASSISRLKAFERAGIETTDHFRNRLTQRAGRGITERNALDAYQNGRLFYNEATGTYIRHSSRTGVSVVTDAPSGGRAITVFEGNPSPSWNPVPWRPGQ